MTVIRVGSKNYREYLEKRFELETKILEADGYKIKIKQIEQGDILFFECAVIDDNLIFEILKEFVANILSDLIINHLELDFLYKILNINCQQLQPEAKNKIINIALNRLNILSGSPDEKIKAKIKRKNRILLEILDYIGPGQEIVVEGFVRFRLKNYLAELELAVETAIEEYGVEEEYKEFVHLLKHYIDMQVDNSKLVNVIKLKNNKFELLDQNKNIIENPFLDRSILNQLQEELEQQDLLISALISLTPREIILHFKKPFTLVEQLKNIFEDRLSICLGCEYCDMKSLKELKEKITTQS